MRNGLALIAVGLVSACSLTDTLLQDTVRQEAKTVVNGLVADKFPGANVAPITDCIIDNATTAEILALGQAAVVGVTPATTQLMTTIASKPAALACITGAQLGMVAL